MPCGYLFLDSLHTCSTGIVQRQLYFASPKQPFNEIFHFISSQADADEDEGEQDTQEELNALVEEAHMPLHSLLAKYGVSNPSKDSNGT